MRTRSIPSLILLLASLALTPALSALELGTPWSDHAVIQRDRAIPVWGWTEPGAAVAVRLGEREATTAADDRGRFEVRLEALPAGGPHALVVRAGERELRVEDVLVGEVWLCSGQSNMAWRVADTGHAEASGRAAEGMDGVRLMTMPDRPAARPADRAIATWQLASDGVDAWSAVGFEAALRLHRRLEVPVGIVEAARGGSRVEAWMPAGAVDDDAGFAAEVARDEEGPRQQLELADRHGREVMRWRAGLAAGDGATVPDPGRQVVAWDWHQPKLDLTGWGTAVLPGTWEGHGLAIDGAVWYRREVEIPKNWKGRTLVVELGAIDDYDRTWFDGHAIGETDVSVEASYRVPRVYRIKGKHVRPGVRSIAVRVWDHWGGGGFNGKGEQMRIYPKGKEGQALPLSGEWRFRVELAIPERPHMPRDVHNQTTVLLNGMIAPLRPVELAGVWWYQGESNARAPAEYATRFPIMINRWRRALESPRLPFHFVQLPRYGADGDDPASNSWAWIREAQTAALELDHTAMVVAIDLGDPKDIHPRDKRPFGHRLADTALVEVYGRELDVRGPRYREHEVSDDGAIRIRFDHADGLTTSDGKPPRAFHIAGENRRWYAARAAIEDGAVVLRHPKVGKPVAVRYAWTASPPVNLVDAKGLPAAPFRTDDW